MQQEKKETCKTFPYYYLTEKRTKSKQQRRELVKSVMLHLSVCKQTWERTVNLFCQKADKRFIVKKEIIVKKSKVEKWELSEISLDVNDEEMLRQLVEKFEKYNMIRGKVQSQIS